MAPVMSLIKKTGLQDNKNHVKSSKIDDKATDSVNKDKEKISSARKIIKDAREDIKSADKGVKNALYSLTIAEQVMYADSTGNKDMSTNNVDIEFAKMAVQNSRNTIQNASSTILDSERRITDVHHTFADSEEHPESSKAMEKLVKSYEHDIDAAGKELDLAKETLAFAEKTIQGPKLGTVASTDDKMEMAESGIADTSNTTAEKNAPTPSQRRPSVDIPDVYLSDSDALQSFFKRATNAADNGNVKVYNISSAVNSTLPGIEPAAEKGSEVQMLSIFAGVIGITLLFFVLLCRCVPPFANTGDSRNPGRNERRGDRLDHIYGLDAAAAEREERWKRLNNPRHQSNSCSEHNGAEMVTLPPLIAVLPRYDEIDRLPEAYRY